MDRGDPQGLKKKVSLVHNPEERTRREVDERLVSRQRECQGLQTRACEAI